MTGAWIEFGAFAWVSLGWVWSIHVWRKDDAITLANLVGPIGVGGALCGPILPIVMELNRAQERASVVILNRYRRN